MDEQGMPPERSAQDRAAEQYLAEARGKKRVQGLWAGIFGCCGCALLIPVLLVPIGMFL